MHISCERFPVCLQCVCSVEVAASDSFNRHVSPKPGVQWTVDSEQYTVCTVCRFFIVYNAQCVYSVKCGVCRVWRWQQVTPSIDMSVPNLAWPNSLGIIQKCTNRREKKSSIRATLGPLVRVIQEYRFYTMNLSQYHGCCQYHESISIP